MRGKEFLIWLVTALVCVALPSAALGRAGDLYISDAGVQSVLRMDPRTGVTEEIATDADGIDIPDGLAFNRRGILFFTDYGGNGVDGAVWKVNPRTKVVDNVTASGEGLQQPLDLVVGADGQLYVSDIDPDAVFRVNPSTGDRKTLAAGGPFAQGGPLGIDRAPSGTLFTVDGNVAAMGNAFGVIRVRPRSGATRLVASGPNPSDGYGFALAPNGKTAWVGDTQLDTLLLPRFWTADSI